MEKPQLDRESPRKLLAYLANQKNRSSSLNKLRFFALHPTGMAIWRISGAICTVTPNIDYLLTC